MKNKQSLSQPVAWR